MRVLLTGAAGFLGWHTQLNLRALTVHEVIPVGRAQWGELSSLMAEADAVIHLAGVNRGTDDEVETGNSRLAQDLAAAIEATSTAPTVVFANSIQSGNASPYGDGKEAASQILQKAVTSAGSRYVDVRLPNLFGEHGRPRYNSFVATFVDAVIAGQTPQINDGAMVELLPVREAAATLVEALDGAPGESTLRPEGSPRGVREVWELLEEFHAIYPQTGELPDLSSDFRIDLFNAYRASLFPAHYPIRLTPHADARGTFVETVRCRGGEGQTSFSTTVPGVTRGDHFHLRKVERFAVISGTARIQLRKMFTTQVLDFEVSGDQPAAIDMPVGWVHNITNTGNDVLLTQFWAHELFRPEAPDTFAEPVVPDTQEVVSA